jgi:ribonuclease E
VRLWKEIGKKAKSINKTSMIYQETDFGVRSLRDYLTSEIDEILVDDLETFRKMRAYLRAISPRSMRLLKHYKEKPPLFDNYNLEEQIRFIYQERVELKSGAHIVINPTEAMITIDVNSGRASNKKNIEETAFKTNIEASEEIARQLRLRDLGGLIVIDFIDMMDKKHIAEVEKSFKKALSIDKARIQLSRISKFGILELSRQKKQSTIQEISYTKCPFCKGCGLRPSLEYAALGAFRKIESEAVKGIYSELRITLPHEIADYILNRKRNELLNLESTFDLTLHIAGSMEIAWDKVEIQQTIKEKTLDAPEPHEETSLKPAENPVLTNDEKVSVKGEEAPKKKSRRRPRHKKKRPAEPVTETSPSTNGAPVTVLITPAPVGENLPLVQNSPAESLPFIIEPAKPKEVAVAPETTEPETHSIETEKKDEE